MMVLDENEEYQATANTDNPSKIVSRFFLLPCQTLKNKKLIKLEQVTPLCFRVTTPRLKWISDSQVLGIYQYSQ